MTIGTCQTPVIRANKTQSNWYSRRQKIIWSCLDSSLSGTVGSCNRGRSCNPKCMASLVDDFHRPASTNRMWNSNRTTFWTFYCRQLIRTVLACHERRSISHHRKQQEFHVVQQLRASISSVRIVRQSCDCVHDEKEENINCEKIHKRKLYLSQELVKEWKNWNELVSDARMYKRKSKFIEHKSNAKKKMRKKI